MVSAGDFHAPQNEGLHGANLFAGVGRRDLCDAEHGASWAHVSLRDGGQTNCGLVSGQKQQ